MGKNVVDAIYDTLKGNFVTGEEKKARLEKCLEPCEHLEPIFKENCLACGGCLVKWKAALKGHSCPKNKW